MECALDLNAIQRDEEKGREHVLNARTIYVFKTRLKWSFARESEKTKKNFIPKAMNLALETFQNGYIIP